WRQSARRDAYEAALAQLAAQGLVYSCACTRRELATALPGPIGERVYAGTCRGGLAGARALRRRASLRVRVPSAPVEFVDRLHGANEQRLAEAIGDFVVRRSDGFFAYQLAVVVDDAALHACADCGGRERCQALEGGRRGRVAGCRAARTARRVALSRPGRAARSAFVGARILVPGDRELAAGAAAGRDDAPRIMNATNDHSRRRPQGRFRRH